MMENLLPDTLHRPVDSLTEGGSSPVPSAWRPLRQCRLRRRLLGLPRRRYDTPSPSCRVYWRSRLISVAWMAPAAELYTLVTCGQQYSLAKVTSGSATAERTYVYRIKCGRWASPSRGSVAAARVPAPVDTWRLRTLPSVVSVPSPLRDPDSMWGSGTP